MRYGLYLPLIQHQGGLDQRLTVSGGAGADNGSTVWQQLVDLFYCLYRCLQRTAVIVIIKGIEQRAVLTHQCHFCGGGTGVDAQEYISLVGGKVSFLHHMLVVEIEEGIVFRLILKERLHSCYLEFHFNLTG